MTALMPSKATQPDHPVALLEAVETVFVRLEAQLGTKVADLYTNANSDAVHNEWADALTGFTKREVNRGLSACQSRIFAPTLGEFLLLCRPALDPDIAWIEASEGLRSRAGGEIGDWSHPAVYRAAASMAYEIATTSYALCRKVWAWRLSKEFAKGWGEPVPPVAKRIVLAEVKTSPPNAEQRKMMAELMGRCKLQREQGLGRPLTSQEMNSVLARGKGVDSE